MVQRFLLFSLLCVAGQPGCIWKLWSEPLPLEERIFDLFGTVQAISLDQLTVETEDGEMTFRMVDSSIKGSNFDAGAYVHVYYMMREDLKVVTMVVEKID